MLNLFQHPPLNLSRLYRNAEWILKQVQDDKEKQSNLFLLPADYIPVTGDILDGSERAGL
ncbi:hypothetical protein DFR46_1165 [Parasphingopyxis lamellibrachiae]|uniref:Uncharacterized protein n=1 Tax=Parasphingopyxis lamellibrachiae TaxID=680125 RepID=A0A3D9FEA0_9SPHN|nr:hypothetical protein DFR46_1165 [Parasphingopyxis lamellibrachiae]